MEQMKRVMKYKYKIDDSGKIQLPKELLQQLSLFPDNELELHYLDIESTSSTS
jgi:hypothetical protein